MTSKKHTVRVTILNEEYAIRTETPPEHARAVAKHLDLAIRLAAYAAAIGLATPGDINYFAPEDLAAFHADLTGALVR